MGPGGIDDAVFVESSEEESGYDIALQIRKLHLPTISDCLRKARGEYAPSDLNTESVSTPNPNKRADRLFYPPLVLRHIASDPT